MKPDRLSFLLERLVLDATRSPVSPQCLGIEAILRFLDTPKRAEAAELAHLTECLACQQAIRLARRERALIDAPVDDERLEAAGGSVPGGDFQAEPSGPPSALHTIKLRPRLARVSAAAGIAAALLIAVGLGWWFGYTPGPSRTVSLLSGLSGKLVPISGTRGGEPEEHVLEYRAAVELRQAAYLSWLYLDETRTLRVLTDAGERAEELPAGSHPVSVYVSGDQPGWQWIGAVASRTAFNPEAVCAELERTIAAQSKDAPLTDVVTRLEIALQQQGLSVLGCSFEVKAPPGP